MQAVKQVESMVRSQRTANAHAEDAAGVWTSIGPQGMVVITDGSYWAGRVTALAADPKNPDVVYMGASDDGVWKTTNGGGSWVPLTDNQPSLSIGALAIDPQNSNVVYAGTGEANYCFDCYFGAGILKTIDGGANWTSNTALLAGPATLPGARPAAKGEAISTYCTGLGPVIPFQQTGRPVPSNPPAIIANPATVRIGNQPATILFAGLAPGFVASTTWTFWFRRMHRPAMRCR
jgi:hypothetical protein